MYIDKPFKTYEEQLDILKSRGLHIEDDAFAISVLSSLPYYSLINGYKNIFTQKNSDLFLSTATFNTIYQMYIIDSEFGHLILKYILVVEKKFKNKLAYTIGQNIDSNHKEYLKEKYYSTSSNKTKSILKKVDEEIERAKMNTPLFFYKNTKGYIPPWILANHLMFGLSIELAKILSDDLKNQLVTSMLTHEYRSVSMAIKKAFILNGLYLLKEFRNSVAHGTRIFNFKLSNDSISIPYLFFRGSVSQNEFHKQKIGNNDFLSIMMIITILLKDSPQKNTWLSELESIKENLNFTIMNKKIIHIFNLPDNFIERLRSL